MGLCKVRKAIWAWQGKMSVHENRVPPTSWAVLVEKISFDNSVKNRRVLAVTAFAKKTV